MSHPTQSTGLWYSEVLPGGEERHARLVEIVVNTINAGRASMRGVTTGLLDAEHAAAGWLLEALCQAHAHLPPAALLLPGSKSAYLDSSAYRVPFPFSVMTRVKAALTALGWTASRAGTVAEGFSQLRAAGELLEHCQALQFAWVQRPAPDMATILQIGKESRGQQRRRRLVADNEAASVAQWRKELHAYNQFLSSQAVYLRVTDTDMAQIAQELADDAAATAHGSQGRCKRSKSPKFVQFGRVALTRIFSGDLQHGGRLYGGWWQNVPSRFRRFIWIGQWQGYEFDFSGMAIRCLYAQEGLTVPDDPYAGVIDFDGPTDARRSILKEYINALLNDKASRYRLDETKLRALGLPGTLKQQAAELERRVQTLHAGIAHHFRTDAGLRMQFVDSEIAMQVLTRMMRRGIAVLPIHDSFIVPFVWREALEVEMQRAFAEITGAQAKLKATKPAVVRHFLDPLIPAAMVSNIQALHDKLDAEYDRFGNANHYFSAWVQQTWSEARLQAELDFGEAFDAETLPHFAFPLGQLRYEGVSKDGEEEEEEEAERERS